MKLILCVIQLALCAILIGTGLARVVLEVENPEKREKSEDDLLFKKFKDMCTPYKVGNKQYAVLWVGDGNYKREKFPNHSPTYDTGDFFIARMFQDDEKRKDPNPSATPSNKKLKTNQGQAVATTSNPDPTTNEKENMYHTEELILAETLSKIDDFEEKGGTKKPKLYLYTLNSPCCGKGSHEDCRHGCSKSLPDWIKASEDRVEYMMVAWGRNYHASQRSRIDQNFLYGLNTLLSEPKIRIFYTEKDLCSPGKKWLQKEMFKCLLAEVNKGTAANVKIDQEKLCRTVTIFKQDLAKQVNRITWNCGTRMLMIRDTFYKHAARDPICWGTEIKNIVTKKEPIAATLVGAAKGCMDVMQKNSDLNKQNEFDLGPALKPSDPETYSNESKDVKDLTDSLCF